MKKTLFSISLVALLTLGACGNKSTETATDSTDVQDSIVAVTETEDELPGADASATSITDALKEHDLTVADNGDIVNKDGKIIMTFKEAREKYGEAFATVMEAYGHSFTEALKEAGENVKDAAGDALEEAKDKAKDVANDAYNAAKDKANEAYNDAKDKAQQKMDEAKDKAKDKLNDALNKIK